MRHIAAGVASLAILAAGGAIIAVDYLAPGSPRNQAAACHEQCHPHYGKVEQGRCFCDERRYTPKDR